MSNRNVIKNTVKVLTIDKPNQKIRFQIRHPENVYAIIGIAVTCSLTNTKMTYAWGDVAGHLTLAIAEKGDVVFTEDVKKDNNEYFDQIENMVGITYIPYVEHQTGNGKHYFETNYIVTESILEGYYEDLFFPKPVLLSNSNSPTKDLYQVRVYIRYQTTPMIKP
jgi:hypothetical protein